MTTYNETPASAPRIPAGTRVRYTELPDRPNAFGPFYYRQQADGAEGTVRYDDESYEAPYAVDFDEPHGVDPSFGQPLTSVIADYNELEILP